MNETDGSAIPDDAILTINVQDDDVDSNIYSYKVLQDSGFGADKFAMVRNDDGTGSLKAIKQCDYDDPRQRQGFRFEIEVSDTTNVNEKRTDRVVSGWVTVYLRDINDNTPAFAKGEVEVTLSEDVSVGKLVEKFEAQDKDKSSQSRVFYTIDRSSDTNKNFAIDTKGTVTLQRTLDRERSDLHIVKILATDDGVPARTGTATLTVNVRDVNDNAPKLRDDDPVIVFENRHPHKIAEVFAVDIDDTSKGNGPPFYFRMDPTAPDAIVASFYVEYSRSGDGLNGSAIVRTSRSFDREYQKIYSIPIVITDSGNKQMTGTSTLTVIIGDRNDNKMQPSSKQVLVYTIEGHVINDSETPIGRVHVSDRDDWDLPDKTFQWADSKNKHFTLNRENGMISMKRGTSVGNYFMTFLVSDMLHSQFNVSANVTVIVKAIPEIAALNSGSVRIANITDESFIQIWDDYREIIRKSKHEMLHSNIALITGVPLENVDVFSVQLYQKRPPVVDVRFSVIRDSAYMTPVHLNGLVLIHRHEIEAELDIDIIMVGIDECLNEGVCEGSCISDLIISSDTYLVNANKTSLAGVFTMTNATCTCEARNIEDEAATCKQNACLNNRKCTLRNAEVVCNCPNGLNGPRCQTVSRSFNESGYAWLPSLSTCNTSHISLQFVTTQPSGLLLYNGPMIPIRKLGIDLSDFIAVELVNGKPILLLDMGSGSMKIAVDTKTNLNDGNLHQIDVFWDTEVMVVFNMKWCLTILF